MLENVKNMLEIKFAKTKKVKTPSRGTDRSSGIDFFVPEAFESVVINPGEHVLIPSGIKVSLPRGWALVAMNKSGVCTKKGLTVGACLIDEDYQGEIHIHLINSSTNSTVIAAGEKIVQFVLKQNPDFFLTETSVDLLHKEETSRGEGGFGSTGNA